MSKNQSSNSRLMRKENHFTTTTLCMILSEQLSVSKTAIFKTCAGYSEENN